MDGAHKSKPRREPYDGWSSLPHRESRSTTSVHRGTGAAPQAGLPRPARDGWRVVDGGGFRLHVDAPGDPVREFAESVARGLDDHPRRLDCRYLYDDRGTEIFARITEQPEYYQTRTEERLLAAHAADIRDRVGNVTLVELGSGNSAKTHRLLEAWQPCDRARYIPIDINAETLASACRDLVRRFSGLVVEGIAASYERALPVVTAASPLQLLFLGSTIGNFDVADTERFFAQVAAALAPGDTFLLGLDLVKDPGALEAAYNDAAGWTARFTKNLFVRMNRELGADVPIEAVEHVAYYNDRLERIEIFARFTREVALHVRPLGRRFRIAAGEMIRTEISRKFRPAAVAAVAAEFGLGHEHTYAAPDGSFAVLLLRREGKTPR